MAHGSLIIASNGGDDAASGIAAPALIAMRHGKRLFSFAVIADSHLEPEAAGSMAPRSNLRNRSVVEWLRPRSPQFVLHLGDIVHPVPQAEQHDNTLVLARQLFAGLQCPVLYTPGNHDIGDKNDDTAPAAAVTQQWLDGYGRVFGEPFQVHHAGGCVLLLINSPILGSGLALEATQKRWLEEQLRVANGKRIFLATHYPPFLAQPQEDTSYDNMERHARHWLLELLARHRVEAVFCGHVHNLFYNRFGSTEIHALPSTSFVRRDYSELHSGAPTDEFGRNDTGKLGFFWVDVFEQGHVARLVQTHGGTDTLELQLPGHPKDPGETPLGVNLCHPWCAQVELPFNPPVDPFARRRVRNDHAVQALWSAGIRHLRAPVADLLDAQVRQRVADMVALGHRFTFFSAGMPSAALLALLREHAPLVGFWECVMPVRAAPELAACAGAGDADAGRVRAHQRRHRVCDPCLDGRRPERCRDGRRSEPGPGGRGLAAGAPPSRGHAAARHLHGHRPRLLRAHRPDRPQRQLARRRARAGRLPRRRGDGARQQDTRDSLTTPRLPPPRPPPQKDLHDDVQTPLPDDLCPPRTGGDHAHRAGAGVSEQAGTDPGRFPPGVPSTSSRD